VTAQAHHSKALTAVHTTGCSLLHATNTEQPFHDEPTAPLLHSWFRIQHKPTAASEFSTSPLLQRTCRDSRLRFLRLWSTAIPMVGANLRGMPASCDNTMAAAGTGTQALS
jgi:hypothetical protein